MFIFHFSSFLSVTSAYSSWGSFLPLKWTFPVNSHNFFPTFPPSGTVFFDYKYQQRIRSTFPGLLILCPYFWFSRTLMNNWYWLTYHYLSQNDYKVRRITLFFNSTISLLWGNGGIQTHPDVFKLIPGFVIMSHRTWETICAARYWTSFKHIPSRSLTWSTLSNPITLFLSWIHGTSV